MRDLILLLTHSGDYYTVDRVEEALGRLGAPFFRLNTDGFPSAWSLTVGFDPGGAKGSLNLGSRRVDLATVKAVWARRLWPGKLPPELDPRFAEYCYRESRTAFFDALTLLDDARWVNPLAQGRAAESKLLQLKLACDVGLVIPTTVVGNDPAPIRELFSRTGGKMVTKLLGALSQTMDASGDFVYTSQVKERDMASIDEVRYAPQIFQALIPKKRELRAVFIGDRTFVGAIDASDREAGRIDWRRLTQRDGVAWREDELPTQVEAATRRLMQRLGLFYGAVDFIVDPDDRYLFLEINQAGEWGWLERDLGFPIAQAIAETLLAEEEPV